MIKHNTMKHLYTLILLFSTTFSFAQDCGTATNSESAPISFGPPPTPVIAVVTVTDDVAITDINVTLNLLHSFLGDLNITLVSPLGTQATLKAANTCGGGDNIVEATFDDDGQAIPANCTDNGINQGTYAPETPLSIFNGESTAGDWTLVIVDAVTGDDGTFQNYTLEFCSDEVLGTIEASNTLFEIYPNPATERLNFNLTNNESLDIQIFDMLGKLVLNTSVGQAQSSVDVRSLAKGNYITKATNSLGVSQSTPLIIN